MIGGDPGCAVATRHSLEAAKANLLNRFAWFGLLECQRLSICLLQERLLGSVDESKLELLQDNSKAGTVWSRVVEDIAPAALVEVRKRNGLDIELVHFAQQHLLSRRKVSKTCALETCLMRR